VSQKPLEDRTVIASYAAGLHDMMRTFVLDMAPIRVNLISPGAVITPLWDDLPAKQMEGFLKVIKEKCTTGEVGKPEDVAEAYL